MLLPQVFHPFLFLCSRDRWGRCISPFAVFDAPEVRGAEAEGKVHLVAIVS